MLDRLDDAINPIVVKELRQAVKSRLVMAALLLLLLLQVVILGIFLLYGEIRHPESVDYAAGRSIFLTLQGIMMGVCMLLIPAYAGVRLAAERSDTNVDLLFISTLKPRAIIWGKFLAAVVLVLIIFSACAPFMTFTYLLRGIDIPSILLVLGTDLLAVLLATMMAVFFASVPTNLALKIVLLLFAFVLLLFQLYMAIGTSVMLVLEGALRLDRPEFWAAFGASVTGVVALMGLLFVWSIALVSPPSANRAPRVRLYTLGVWVATAVAAGWGTYYIKHPGLLYSWQGIMLFLFCLQLVISINERDHWGPRVARAIPRNGWLRVPAFLTYSGAAGGLLFGVLMLALTVGLGTAAVYWWQDVYSYPVRDDRPGHVALVMTIVWLYVYAYALTAVLCRRLFFRDMLKPVFTWVLMAVLMAVGSAVPYLIILVVPDNSMHFEHDNTWVLLTNPLASAITAADPRNNTSIYDFDKICLLFVSVWSVLVTLLCLPWFAAQVRDFRPPSRPAGTREPVLWARPVPAAAVPNGEAAPHVAPEAVTPPGAVQEAPAGEPGA
jgi:hypothetical protein